ncbi:MAG: hypothetical protein V1802_01005, partial [Candidatus Aenigmatarchaeota archaeon]
MAARNYITRRLVQLAAAATLFFCWYDSSQPPFPSKPERLEQRISHEAAVPNGKADKYAVLISGNTESRHRVNLSLAYQILLENGFRKDNIYILDYDGKEVFYYPVDDFAGKECIKMVFGHLRKKIDEQDLLFVYATDHGKRISKITRGDDGNKTEKLSALSLPGPDIDQKEFAKYLDGINPRKGIFLFDQCYGGGFAEEIGKERYIAVASAKPYQGGYGKTNNTFGGYFMLAFR